MVIYLNGNDQVTLRYPATVDGRKALSVLQEHIWQPGSGDPLEPWSETTFEVLP